MKSITFLLLAGLLSATHTYAHPFFQHDGQSLRAVFSQLDLSFAQKQDLRQYMRQAREQMQLQRQDVKLFRQQLQDAIRHDSFDQDAVEALIDAQHMLMTDLAMTRAIHKHYAWHVLEPSQREQFRTLMSRETSVDVNKRLEEVLNKLALTEQQQDQISESTAVLAQGFAQFRALREARRDAELSVIAAGQFDQDAWLAVHQGFSDEFKALALQHAQARHQIWNALDTSQQQTLDALQENRSRHRQYRKAHLSEQRS